VADAARGEAETLCELGVCYHQGDGVPQSYERAAELLQQAAAKGSNTVAQYNLGTLYRDGQGVPQSYERAAELWQQAAAKGHALAQTCQGGLYYNGKGVPKDVARGVALFKQAAAGGSKAAADLLRALGEAVPPGASA
jgi:TPR repeat protein